MPPLSALDRLEIRELAACSSWADDTADDEAFTPDDRFRSTRHNAPGYAELAALGRSIAPAPPTGIQHRVTNLVIEGDAERAPSKCYFVLHSIDAGSASM